MSAKISSRLLQIIEALPLKKGMRILEIGCGPGVAAREIVKRFDGVYLLALDRSLKAIELAKKGSVAEIESGRLKFMHSKIENFSLPDGEKPFDIAFAIRVGALDGRHPEIRETALATISKALKKNGQLFIDGGNPLKEIKLHA
jgi:SAM-dependent methyltransferase